MHVRARATEIKASEEGGVGNEEGESARERKAVSQDAGNPNQLRQVIEVQQRNWKAREMEMPPTSWKYLEHIGCRIVLESSHVKQEIAANISIQDRAEARYAQVSVHTCRQQLAPGGKH